MSTQPFSETKERVQEALKETSELISKTNASLMDSYNKQMAAGLEFYKKLSEKAKNEGADKWTDIIKESTASSEKAIKNAMNQSKESMEKIVAAFSSKEWSPLSKKSADDIQNIFTKQAEQSRDFGTQFLQAMQQENILSPEAFIKQSERFSELMSKSIKSSESTIKELIASYNEQTSSTQEASKNLMNHIQKQVDALAKTHQNFTEEMMNSLNKNKTSADLKTNQTKSKDSKI
jgi:hypothetical protein